MKCINCLCKLAVKEGEIPGDWTKAAIIPVFSWKGEKNNAFTYGKFCSGVPDNMQGGILMKKVQKITKGKVCRMQKTTSLLRKWEGCAVLELWVEPGALTTIPRAALNLQFC